MYKRIQLTESMVQSIAKNTFSETLGIRYSKRGNDYTEPELNDVVKKIQERIAEKI